MKSVFHWLNNRLKRVPAQNSRSAKASAKTQRAPLDVDCLESRLVPSTVTTDQADYAPGSLATINGAGFQAGETVKLSIVHIDTIYQNTYAPWDVTDGDQTPAYTDLQGTLHMPDLDGAVNGSFQTTWQVGQIPDSTLQLTATGLTSGDVATTTFTDAAHFNTITVGSQTGSPTYGAGNTATFSVAAGFNGSGGTINVALSLTWNATNPGVGVSFSPSTVTNSSPNSTLTLTTSATTVPGSYAFTVTGNDGSSTHTGVGTLVVSKKGLTITANSSSKTYGNAVTFAGTEFSTNGLVNSDSVSSVTLTSTGAVSTATVAGSPYAITPSAAVGTNLGNYNITYTGGSLTVNTRALTVTANSTSKTYGSTTTFGGTEFTTSGLVNSDSVSSVSLASSGAAATATVAGSPYAITASNAVGTGLSNYTIGYVAGSLTVNQKSLSISANNQSKTYGDAFTFNGTEFSTIGLVNGDSVTSATISSTGADATAAVAGSPYAIDISDAVGTGLDNYSISYGGGSLTVDAKSATVTANNTSKTYGDTVTFVGDEFSANGFVNGDSVDSVTLTSAGADATAAVSGSPYAIAASAAVGSGLDNYAITYVDGSLSVSAKDATVTADSTSKTYGDAVTFAGTEFSATGLVNGDTFDSVTLTSDGAAATAGVAGSPYSIVASAATGTATGNYNITYVDGTLVVNQKSLTVTANSTTKTYGDTTTFAGTEFTTDGLVNSDSVDSVSLSSAGAAATATVAGSPYSIVPSAASGTGLDNYDISYVNGSLTVTQKDLTVTANNATKTYGSTKTFSGTEFSSSGLVNSDSVTSVTLTSTGAASTATVAGSPYDIVASNAVGTGLANYSISYTDGSLTVTTKSATITANNRTKTYGAAVVFAGTEFSASGLVNGDTVTSVTLTSSGTPTTATVSGSPYSITPSSPVGTGTDNYSFSFVDGSLTVNPKALTITADSTSKTYGNTVTFAGTEFTTSGLVNSDSVTSVTLTSSGAAAAAAVSGSPYSIVPSNPVGTGLSNYSTSFANGSLTVNQRGVTITGITAEDRNYNGGTDATLDTSAAAVSGLVNGDAVTANTSAAVGTFANPGPGVGITVNITGVTLAGAKAGNYFITAQPTTTATINPAAGDVVVNGTGADDTLVLSGNPGDGDITYVLNGGTPVNLTGVTSFTFNGQGGDDSMTINIPEEGTLFEGSVTFDGGTGVNTLTVDNAYRWIRITSATMDVGSIYDTATQNIAYSNVSTTAIDNASPIGSFYGPNTADRGTALSGLSADQRFVQVLYLNVLGRAGSIGELNYWVGVMHAQGNSQITVAQAIEGSFEGRERIVVGWYADYLNREASSDEQAFWANFIISHGQSEETALGLILGSPEFYGLTQTLVGSGTANERYAAALYQVLLQRTASAGEIDFWANTYLSGHSTTQMAGLFLSSPEYRMDQAESYYQSLLHRTGDDGGLHYWGFTSTADFYTMRTQFESTAEFYVNG